MLYLLIGSLLLIQKALQTLHILQIFKTIFHMTNIEGNRGPCKHFSVN